MHSVANKGDRKIILNLKSGKSLRLPAKGDGPPMEIEDEDADSPELVALKSARPPRVAVTKIVSAEKPVVAETPSRAARRSGREEE